MIKKDARTRSQESVGTHITRRSVARGMAWTAPVVAVATSAPAFAASTCTPIVSFSSTSCRCTGNANDTQPKAYFVSFCVSLPAGCITNPTNPGTFTIEGVLTNGSRNPIPSPPVAQNCGFKSLPISGTIGASGTCEASGACCTDTVRLLGDASGIKVIVQFRVNGGPILEQQVTAPNDCGSPTVADPRCTNCVQPPA